MCGITGLWQRGGATLNTLREHTEAMTDALTHRGPDSGAVWCDAAAGVGLGHRRLAIIDLSADGAQPMHSRCERYALVYNGEIYNHEALRAELTQAGERFKGHSDTEVLVAALARWGVARTLPRLNGMFAFAWWDRQTRTMTLARDRLGIKPLYWARQGDTLLFASELKALRAHPDFSPHINRDALALMMRHAYLPAPWCIYDEAHKLAPGHFAVFAEGQAPRLEPWWSLRDLMASPQSDRTPPFKDARAARAALQALLRDAVKARMMADVPLGAFLSGGIDSSLIVALMQSQSATPVKTFTIGFREQGFDEAPHAHRVAEHLGTEHTELYLDAKDSLALIPALSEHWDEPFADPSQIPTLLVSRLARRHVTVSLSGDGGDELFGGYGRYWAKAALWRRFERLPASLQRPLSELGARWERQIIERGRDDGLRAAFWRRAAYAVGDPTLAAYRMRRSWWPNPTALVLGAQDMDMGYRDPTLRRDLPEVMARMMFIDMLTYLPGDLLTKVDRASMAVSLEARVPLLDHRVVEFAWRLPLSWRVSPRPKGLLRAVLGDLLPASLIDRPKQGFSVPTGAWLRGPLRDWAESLLNPDLIRRQGYLDPAMVQRAWRQTLNSAAPEAPRMWHILTFQGWLSRWG